MMSSCFTCGYQWKTGTSGGHSCATELLKSRDANKSAKQAASLAIALAASEIASRVPYFALEIPDNRAVVIESMIRNAVKSLL